jgi:methylated-DNA-[protein]-cysteine S-methyltransferase
MKIKDPLAYGEVYDPHIGSIGILTSSMGLTRVKLLSREEQNLPRKPAIDNLAAFLFLQQAVNELGAYFAGRLVQPFTIPIDWSGISGFQKLVLDTVSRIPYGSTQTYGEITGGIGKPQAARAVGLALSTNPFLIFIPCHRVIGSDHRLHGFAAPGGIETKAWLLQLEGVRFDKDLVTE